MDKPYCIHYFPEQKYACYYDRGYNYLGDDREVWGKVKMGDIVEFDETTFYPQASEKAHELKNAGHRHITFWTSYYDG